MTRKHGIALTAALVGLLGLAADVRAQTIGLPGQTARDNVRGGAVRTRNPGQLVSDGVVRHADFSDRQALGTVITDAPLEDPFPGLIADALQIVFDQINQAIAAFRNLLLIRAGETPTTSSTSNSSTNSGSTTNNGNSSGGGRR